MINVIAIENGRKAAAAGPQNINDFMNEPDEWPALTQLFDEFWREGELALLFGASGTGKSILAMQIADALARGSRLDGFSMPTSGKRVLYVDLQHAGFQFKARYRDSSGRQYSFSERIFRDRPKEAKDLVGWLRDELKKRRFDVVVIDDIGSLKTTNDGVRETLAAMRELRRLRDEMMVSILVVSDASAARGKYADESDLGCSRVLCTVADSVFALSPWNAGQCRVMQTRSRSSAIVWTAQIAPIAKIMRLKGGMLGFQFDERFIPEFSPGENDLALEIKARHEIGKTYRQIAEELGISKTRAQRLHKKLLLILRLRELGEEVHKRIRRRKLFDDDEEYYDPDPIVIADTFPGCEEYDKAREHERFGVLDDDDLVVRRLEGRVFILHDYLGFRPGGLNPRL
jgi:KaiC/GvpD/RAD55 family RecA-like ATPase